jgi:hypothetical protein
LTGPSVTLSSTLRWANRLNDWNTMPTSLRRRANARPSLGRGRPSNVIVPESIGSSRLMTRHSVDLPDPLGPTTTTTSPAATVRFTSRSTCTGPKCFSTAFSTINGCVTAATLASGASPAQR